MPEDGELDLIEGTDEDGRRLQLSVEKYFFYNGEEYVLLKEYLQGQEAPAAEDGRETLYVMRVAVSRDEAGEEIEEFEPIDEELTQRLLPVIRARWASPE